MAKKDKQNIVIVDKELTPTIIGKLDKTEKSPALLIIIFIIFIAVAIFLPDITGYVESYLNGNKQNIPSNPSNNYNDNNNTEKPNVGEEITYYDYATDLSILTDLFTMSNIVLSENKIYFDLTNTTNSILNLNDYKYFLEIYSSENTLIQRIKISYDTIDSSFTKSYNYDLDDGVADSLAKLLIVSKQESDYPEVNLSSDADGNGLLVCTKDYETITYTFGNNLLISINDIVNYQFNNSDTYSMALQSYQVLAATYNNYEGVSSTLITSETGFTYTTLIDLRNADIKNIENNNYYNYRAQAKTVKFETESNGFSCR